MIRILILSNVRLYSDGLTEILNREPDFEVVGNFSHRDNPITLITKFSPDAVLLDMNMNDSLNLAKTISALNSNIHIIVLGINNNKENILKFAEVGVGGYVTREDSLTDLKSVVKNAVQDEFCCNPRTARLLLRHISSLASQTPQSGELTSLTRREHQVGRLLAQGLSNKEIAREMHIEISTVKNHVHNILEKLHIRRRSEVASLFHR